MRLHSFVLASVLVLGIAACGSNDGSGGGGTGPSPTYESVAGNYAGVMSGLSQGIALNANFALTLTQNAATLGGSYGISGTLNDGVSSVSISGTGTVSGSIASGANPSVNITVHPVGCPNLPAQFSGAYDSANHRLTMTGPVQMFDAGCSVFLTYQITFILNL